MSNKVTYEVERFVYPYVFLWSTCEKTFSLASDPGNNPILLVSGMLLTSFCLESYLNHLIMMRHGGDWRNFERNAAPKTKLDVMAQKIGLSIDTSKRPFQSFSQIFQFRNGIAHAKTEHLHVQVKMSLKTFLSPDSIPPDPLTKWEKLITKENAHIFHEDTRTMISQLHSQAGLGADPFDHEYSEASWKQL